MRRRKLIAALGILVVMFGGSFLPGKAKTASAEFLNTTFVREDAAVRERPISDISSRDIELDEEITQGCDDLNFSKSAWISCQGGQYVEIHATSARGDSCPGAQVQAEAWLNPGGTPTVVRDSVSAAAVARWNGNFWGLQSGDTKHWYIKPDSTYLYKGSLHATGDCGDPPPPECTDPPVCECSVQYDPETCECLSSPIIVDLGNEGYHLTSSENGVWFDLQLQGYPQHVAWTEADSQIAFLVLDRNGNGRIDDGSELFGTATSMGEDGHAQNGFAALIDLDGGRAHSDGVIDSSDSHYSQLRLWIDRNHNGISEPDELFRLSDKGVVKIFLGYRETHRQDRYGNHLRYTGTMLREFRNGQTVPRNIYDVFLKVTY